MFIGQAARLSGLSVKAIRFYEAQGLIPSPTRQGRYRSYSGEDVVRLRLLCEARRFGFSLAVLRDLMKNAFTPGHCERVHAVIEQRRATLLEQVRELEDQLLNLSHLQQRLLQPPELTFNDAGDLTLP